MAAAVVKLNALTNAVGTAAKDHHLLFVGRPGFVRCRPGKGWLIGRVHIGCRRGKFCGAGVYPLVNRAHTQTAPQAANLDLCFSRERR